MSLAGYDGYKLATPPEYEQGDPPESEDEPEEIVCSECRTVTLVEFSDGGRCEDCDGPTVEPRTLDERLHRVYTAATKRGDNATARKAVDWMERLDEMEAWMSKLEKEHG